jgi:hypothetical protein
VKDFQSVLERVKFYDTGFLIMVNEENGLVMNNPYDIDSVYYIFDSDITGLNQAHWNQIKNEENQESILSIFNIRGEEILIIRNFL